MLTIQCHFCKTVFQIAVDGQFLCPQCQTPNFYSAAGLPPQVMALSPWEESFSGHPFAGFFTTIRKVMATPVEFFSSLSIGPHSWKALLFALICQIIAGVSVALTQLLLSFLKIGLLQFLPSQPQANAQLSALAASMGTGFSIIIVPVASILGLALSICLYHVLLLIFGASKKGVEGTIAAVCYSTAPQILCLIPLIGSLVAGFWQWILIVIGIKEIHKTSYAKAILIVLFPMICCCSILLLGIFAAVLIPSMAKNL